MRWRRNDAARRRDPGPNWVGPHSRAVILVCIDDGAFAADGDVCWGWLPFSKHDSNTSILNGAHEHRQTLISIQGIHHHRPMTPHVSESVAVASILKPHVCCAMPMTSPNLSLNGGGYRKSEQE